MKYIYKKIYFLSFFNKPLQEYIEVQLSYNILMYLICLGSPLYIGAVLQTNFHLYFQIQT